RRGRARRGWALCAALLTASFGGTAPAAVPAPLLAATVKAAALLGADPAAAWGGVSAQAAALARGALTRAGGIKTILLTALVVAAGLATLGAGWVAHQTLATRAQKARPGDGPRPAAKGGPPQPEPSKAVRTDRHGDPLP